MRVTGELIGGKELAPILCEFIAHRSGVNYPFKANANAIGILRGDRIIVAVAYTDFRWPSICMHIASEPGTLWASPMFLYHMFAYPFLDLECRRATAVMPKKNKRCRALCDGLGFKLEGTMRKALPSDDLMVYGLLREECRYFEAERKVA